MQACNKCRGLQGVQGSNKAACAGVLRARARLRHPGYDAAARPELRHGPGDRPTLPHTTCCPSRPVPDELSQVPGWPGAGRAAGEAGDTETTRY
jgi:hypothetical protein